MTPIQVLFRFFILGAFSACEISSPEVQEGADAPLSIAADHPELCSEPPEQRPLASDLAAATADASAALAIARNVRGDPQVAFQGAASQGATFTTITSLELDDSLRATSMVEKSAATLQLRVQKSTSTRRVSAGRVILSTKGAVIQDVDLVTTYTFEAPRVAALVPKHALAVSRLALVNRATGAPIDTYDPDLTFTDAPANCMEQALVIYGPLPAGLPPLRWPQIEGCSGERCVSVALSWVHLHHNVYRAGQMFALMDSLPEPTRSYAWGRPGTDADGEAASDRTSPSYWFGAYDSERYGVFREAVLKYGDILRRAKIGSTQVHLQCPVYAENPGNVCFNASVGGHHWVRGWVNFCASSFGASPTNDVDALYVHEVMHHEPLHHVFVTINGVKRMLRDKVVHGHGNLCASNIDSGAVYHEHAVRHFVTEGGSCDHDDKLMRIVDAYALFVLRIGNSVRKGEMTHWPKWADPTPQAPVCLGGDGCLCLDTPANQAPDGDYQADKFCEDNDGLSVCMQTTFNASQTVGVCTRCDDLRGPGCPCNDVSAQCEEGFCFGDDTRGNAAGQGTCYQADPPAWACLADCERLLGNGAFCMHDHPDHGRCVPVVTTRPAATTCWEQGGHMDPGELECSYAPECIVTADCAELGYPGYFACDPTLRCVPAL